jgi:hypothetical protein
MLSDTSLVSSAPPTNGSVSTKYPMASPRTNLHFLARLEIR